MRRALVLSAALVLISAALAVANTCVPGTQLGSDQELLAFLQEIKFVAEGRIGIPGAGDFELDLGPDTGAPFVTAEYSWPNGGAVPFELTATPNAGNLDIVFTMAPGLPSETVLNYSLAVDPDMTAIVVRTRAVDAGTVCLVDNMTLNGHPVCDVSVADGDADGLGLLLLEEPDLVNGFTLTGDATLSWAGTMPTRSRLAFQVKVGNPSPVPAEPATWGGLKQLGL
jgi:hypothetical protein